MLEKVGNNKEPVKVVDPTEMLTVYIKVDLLLTVRFLVMDKDGVRRDFLKLEKQRIKSFSTFTRAGEITTVGTHTIVSIFLDRG